MEAIQLSTVVVQPYVWIGLHLSRSSGTFQLTGLGHEAAARVIHFLSGAHVVGSVQKVVAYIETDSELRVYAVVQLWSRFARSPMSRIQGRLLHI